MALGNVHLTPQLVQAVRDATDIVAIAGDHTRLKKSGRRLSGLCPLHKEKTPSFSVDEAQGLFYCFGCGQGGDAIKLHMLLSGDDFPTAIEALATRFGVPLPRRSPVRHGERQPQVGAALEAAQRYFVAQLARSEPARAYLEQRRVPAELVERFGLGYAPPGWQGLLESLTPEVARADLEAAGLVARSEKSPGRYYDRFRHRLMFPIRNTAGRLVGFGGRALGDDAAKYLNTAETERFHKGYLLYGLDQAKRAIRERGRALVVEGFMDALAAAACGIEWVVATMGTAFTQDQARLLARFADEVVIGYDGDSAGEAAFRRALPVLLAEGLAVLRPRFEAGHDPDSIRLAYGEKALVEAIEAAEDAVTQELARLVPPEVRREPRRRAKAGQAVIELLRPIRDGILRYGYGRQAASLLGVPEELLWKGLGVDRTALRPAAPQPQRTPGEVLSLEERTVQMLLAGDEKPPPVEALPPVEAFLDEGCRNIYRAFLALYREGEGSPPATREVLASLADEEASTDAAARLLLEDSGRPGKGELGPALERLARRWQQQRMRHLSMEIAAAQRAGEDERLAGLLEEKEALSRIVHRRSR